MKLTRRTLLKVAGVAGGGLILGIALNNEEAVLPINKIDGAFIANAFLQLTPDNEIIFYFPRDEMGQGAIMGLVTLIAEELDVHPKSIKVEFAGVHSAYNHPEFGSQMTGGSTSMRVHYEQLRQSAASLRSLLLNAAALDLNVSVDELSTRDAMIVHNDKTYPYSNFTSTAESLEVPLNPTLTPKDKFKYIGKDIARIDGQAKSTGTAIYGIDVDVPGMHYAVIARCPVAGGSVKSFSASEVLSLTGVTDVVQIDSGVAVVAKRYWQAKKALGKLQINWNMPELAGVDTAQIKQDYQELLNKEEGNTFLADGDIEVNRNNSVHVVESEYWAPYLAHATMEPMNAVVEIKDNKANVWAGTQSPTSTQALVARVAGLKKQDVNVHGVFLGGGFGRRVMLSYVTEATQLAVATAKPIKLIWSREDDTQHAYYRPASLMKIESGVDSDGKLTLWNVKRVGANTMPHALKAFLPGILPVFGSETLSNFASGTANKLFDSWLVDESGVEGFESDYDFGSFKISHVTKDHGLPVTFWRSVGHSFTAFAKESHIDELAEKAGIDAIEFRLKNSRSNPRLQGVIEHISTALSQRSTIAGRFVGVAAHSSFKSFVAQAAEVSVEGKNITVHRVICAVDCGQVVNPDIVKGQMEGSIMFGLTAALFGKIDLDAGAVQQSNFHDYPILRMNQAPQVEVIIVDSEEAPTGAGEPGLPPIAPAVANAVYRATKQRLRSLPLTLV